MLSLLTKSPDHPSNPNIQDMWAIILGTLEVAIPGPVSPKAYDTKTEAPKPRCTAKARRASGLRPAFRYEAGTAAGLLSATQIFGS